MPEEDLTQQIRREVLAALAEEQAKSDLGPQSEPTGSFAGYMTPAEQAAVAMGPQSEPTGSFAGHMSPEEQAAVAMGPQSRMGLPDPSESARATTSRVGTPGEWARSEMSHRAENQEMVIDRSSRAARRETNKVGTPADWQRLEAADKKDRPPKADPQVEEAGWQDHLKDLLKQAILEAAKP